MAIIRACECIPANFPPLDPIEAPDFANVQEFETWLRQQYIPKTKTMNIQDCPGRNDYLIDINKTECWGIFSPSEECLKCCLVYPQTNLKNFEKFEDFLRGKIFSHNHLTNTTLSLPDVLTWANLHILEFRAVTEDCTYIIKPLNHEWPNPDELLNKIQKVCPFFKYPSRGDHGKLLHQCYQTLAERKIFVYESVETAH